MKTIPPPILAILAAASVEGLVVTLNSGVLHRRVYSDVNKVLVALGGRWDRKVGGHVFAPGDDPAGALDAVVRTGVVTDWKKEANFFETPKPLAEELVGGVDFPRPGMKVLEPSAGRGALLDQVPRDQIVVVMELDKRHTEALHDVWATFRPPSLLLMGSDFEAYASSYGKQPLLTHPDVSPRTRFDVIVMNPPFSSGRDVRHVDLALDLLAPGGQLAAIMSAGVTFREDRATVALRARLEAMDASITPCGEGAFRASGTMVRSVMVRVRAPAC